MQKKYHLIAIGGSVMHNVALDLHAMGHQISGSDDEIYEPSRSRLEEKGLLPPEIGWFPQKITTDIDAVILGKHARIDNPELIKAQELGLKIFSFPEFISKSSNASKRVCVAGSHGKTSTTAMIMHALMANEIDFDYLVGAQLAGFDKMVRISDSDILICEADEYASSALDPRPKMLHYKGNIAVITGIAWDHVNIFKTYGDYVEAFRQFLHSLEGSGVCFYDQNDEDLNTLVLKESFNVARQSYNALQLNKNSEVVIGENVYPVQVFGKHNMLNMHAAYLVCRELGLNEEQFFNSMENFRGAAKRLQLVREENPIVYRDFAHAPSKCLATVNAVRSRYPDKKIKAILELHTYSSLDSKFIVQYENSMNNADSAIVFYDKHAMQIKRMPDLDAEKVKTAFAHDDIEVSSDAAMVEAAIKDSFEDGTDVLLIMSSGALGGLNIDEIIS